MIAPIADLTTADASREVAADVQLALRTLAARYASAADHKDNETFARSFLPDGVITVVRKPGRGPVVRKGYEELLAVLQTLDPFIRTYHHLGQIVYRYASSDASDSVIGEVYCVAHHVSAGEFLTDETYYIRYQDRYQLVDGAWYFATRHIHIDFKSVTQGVHHVHEVTPGMTPWA